MEKQSVLKTENTGDYTKKMGQTNNFNLHIV